MSAFLVGVVLGCIIAMVVAVGVVLFVAAIEQDKIL